MNTHTPSSFPPPGHQAHPGCRGLLDYYRYCCFGLAVWTIARTSLGTGFLKVVEKSFSLSQSLYPMVQPTIYFVVTASLSSNEGEKDTSIRRQQYGRGIESLLNATKNNLPLPHKVIVVENGGRRSTFLDEINGLSVLYTDNNLKSNKASKGTKELMDVLTCVKHFQMRDHDLVVKMTGRYYLDENSSFVNSLYNLDWNQTHAIVKFGSYDSPSDLRQEDCITALIMMPVASLKLIKPAEIIEHSWARAALALPSHTVEAVQGKMGIFIAPAGIQYFLV